jgi:nicotinate-nucleotide adenylyltransferase
MRRVGMFGGSFNPPHRAHRALARLACDVLALDELRWLPAGQPWQKPAGDLAPPEHRLAMVQALVQGEPRFVVDNRELCRQGPSYTLDTVRELSAEQPGTEWVLVIGQDQYARLASWHGWRELLASVTLAVAAREGQAVQAPPPWPGCRTAARCCPCRKWTSARRTSGRGWRPDCRSLLWWGMRWHAILINTASTGPRPATEWTSENCNAPSSMAWRT